MRPVLAAALAATLLAPCATAQTLVVAHEADATAWLMDADSGQVHRRLETGRGPHEAATSPDGRFVVISDYGDGATEGRSLTVLDVKEGRVHRSVDLAEHPRPHGLDFLERERLLVTAETTGELLVVDAFTGRVTDSFPTQARVSHLVAAHPLKHRAYVANIASGSMTTQETDQLRYRVQTRTGAGAEGIAVSPDGREAWVTNRAENTVTVVHLDTMAIAATLPAGDFPIRVAFTPDGAEAWVTNARGGDAWVYDVERREVLAVVALGQDGAADPVPIGILMRPCGSEVFLALAGADELAVVDTRTFRVKRRLATGGEPDGMAWAEADVEPTPGRGKHFEELLSFDEAPGRQQR